jgi:hypothetical protein
LTTDTEKFLESVAKVNPVIFTGSACFFIIFGFFFDSFCVKTVVSRLITDISMKEVLPIKGASYLINIFNYAASNLIMGYFLKNKKEMSFQESLSPMFYIAVIDFTALNILMLIGIILSGNCLREDLRILFLSASILTICGFMVFSIIIKAGKNTAFFKKITDQPVFAAFRRARLVDHLFFLSLRGIFIFHYIFVNFIMMRIFDMPVPLSALILYVPLLTFIAMVPVTISGLGTVQIASRYFYAPFLADAAAPFALVDAYTTSTILFFLFIRVIISLFYVDRVKWLKT